MAETAFLTIRDRIDDVTQLLTKSPKLPDDKAAQLLRLSDEDYTMLKELAMEGGYLRSERKRHE